MFLKWPTTAPKVDCHHPQVENAEDALFQLVELWEGLEPTSPLPFDPDGEFVLLPRPGNYEYPDLNAVESLSEFALHPVPFYVYTAQHFRGYLEKKLSPFKISRKVKHENRLDSCSSPEKDFDNQQTIQKAEGDVAASSLTDTDFVEEHSTQQIERKRGWSFAFKSKKNPHQSAKELVLEENILTSNVSHSLDTPEINGSGQERAEQEQLSPVIADNSKDFSDNFGLTSVSEGEDEPDGLKIFRSSKARDSNSSKSLKSASSLETSGSWRSQISQSLFPSFAKGYFKSDSLPTDSLAPNTQPINQDSEDQSGSSGECGDSDTSLDCFPENGNGEDKTRDQEKQLEGPGQLVSHSSLSRRRGFHKTLATGFHEKILSQSLHDLVDPSSLFNVTSEEKSQQGDTSSVTNESTDESQPQTDNISFEVLKDSFQIANTVPSKGRLWPLIPFLWWRRSKADNSDVSSNRLEKRAVSLDSVFTELSSYLTQQAGEGEVVNFTNTCEKFEEFNAPGQRLYNTVDGLSRIVGMGMAEEGGNRNGGSPGGPLRSNSAYRLRSLAGKLFSSLSTNENVTNSDSRERRKLSQTTMESSDEDGRTLDIAATSDSRARAKTYRLQVDSKRLKTEWTSTQDDVESFVGTAAKSLADGFGLWKQQDQEEEKEESIITGHWENTKNHKKCQGCQASFSALALVKRVNKRDHCRKCGKVFCKGCLKYTRKLNTFAQYDPGGKEFKVCELCYKPKTVPVVEGQTHSHTKSFRDFRDEFSRYGWDKDLKDDEYRFEPTASSMLRQCKKLEKGFRDSYLQKSEQKSTNIGMMKKVVPDWQKPPTWVDPTNKDITGCQLCNQGTFLPGSLHNCRICGRRVCSSDSSTNFMLYIPDSGTVEHSTSPRPRWTVIRIVGCPPTEPAVHLYLRICFTCQDKLSNLQEKSYENMMFTLSKEYQLGMKMLQEIHSETQKMKSKIQEMMPKFLDTVENLGREPKNISETDRKSLANHQESLIDQFPKFIVSVEKLKDIRPITEQQVKLVQKVFQEKLSFYRENVATFRITGRQLMEIMPEGEIKQLQLTVNQEAINCTCLIVTQLAFEVLEISMKKKLKESESFAMIIKKVSEIIEEDLKQLMTNSEGDWEGHQKQIYGFVKSEMMEADRRLIKVNKANGVDLQTFIKQECYRKIKSTILQLEAKSSSRNFKSSKVALEKLLNECSTEK